MAVAKMKLVSVIGHMNSLDRVVQTCGDSGVFQPDDAMTFFSDTSGFTPVKEENPYSDPLNRLETAVSRLDGVLRETDLPAGMPDGELIDYVNRFTGQVSELARQRSEYATRVESLDRDIEQFQHLKGLDIDLDSIMNCKTIKVRFGRLPKESFEKLRAYNDNPYVLFFPGASDNEYYWGVYFSPLDFAADVDRIFSSLYFERMRVPNAHGTPEEIVAHLEEERREAQTGLEKVQKEMAALWEKEAPVCMQVYSQLRQKNYYFGIRKYAARYNDKFILTGWIPKQAEKSFRTSLDRIDGIEYSFERPDQDSHHVPPVTLHNFRLFRPFEFFVDMYGLPRYSEVDPTPFVAVTYIILFGIMFADVGQGLLVALIGWLLWKFKRMAVGRVLIPCGFSSAVFGCVFGSVFGFEHVLDPLYHALFGLEEKPIEVMQSSTTIMILASSVAIGVVIIAISMALNIYSCLRQKDYENGLFGPNGVAGLVFYLSIIIGLVCQMLLKLPVMNIAYILLLLVLPLLLMFLREPLGKLMAHDPDWKPEKISEFIIQNFFELFEQLLSYLSNTMSFLRVAAFVLVHAGMMMAVFAIGGMFQTVGYTVAVIVGNALVMGMECVLVVIQIMRLEFYEMFSRYYNGDGKPFQPLTLHPEKNS